MREHRIKVLIGRATYKAHTKVCSYLNTASLTAPMDNDWSQIYLYVACKTYRRWHKSEMPEDIRADSLSDKQLSDLNRLKEWLYRRRTAVRQDGERAVRRQKKEVESAQRETEQPALFKF